MTDRGDVRGRLAALSFVVLGVAAGAAPTLAADAIAAAPTLGAEWTGGYAGLHAGGAWGNVVVTDTDGGVPPGPFPYSAAGAFGGGTAGFNLPMNQIVVGIEGDVGYMALTGAGIIPSSTFPFHQDATLGGGLYGDVTGRLGLSFGQTLVYGKGGFAFYDGEANQVTTKPGYVPTGTSTSTGWTIGAGVEHYFSPTMSFKLEYQRFDFGTQGGNQTSVGDPPIGFVYHNSHRLTADSVKVGVNWHFAGS